ncbi:carbohydrate kinase family protein [Rhizobium leguminosarum]|uniref:carbohydrate kinase family protein n=1 Tax=Rhizobium leguminosarum TaxID=384 RepID=UPI001C988042|nr:carbohydrate kinase family protein [Rhizobium leguminosarum]
MDIAGGIYRELCETPGWDEEFGSGGRAAAAVSAISPVCILHSYCDNANSRGIRNLRDMGIHVRSRSRVDPIVFAYFHPLSKPHIKPDRFSIQHLEPLRVAAKSVLRFGFLEGSAVVNASRAVYDPQTSRDPEFFAANGSRADELALVMNETELLKYARSESISAAANALLDSKSADVVVVKQGIRGASVFQRGSIASTPPYRSSAVFKIGTGDVFSGVFAYYWAEVGMAPADATDLASRAVAVYCETRHLPLSRDFAEHRVPIVNTPHEQVVVRGTVATIGRRFTLEEARFSLRELGIKVAAPDLGDVPSSSLSTSLLVISDGLSDDGIFEICRAHSTAAAISILDETRAVSLDLVTRSFSCEVFDDFTTALYSACWQPSLRAGKSTV